MKIVQIANTLAHEDGGPARNSFELNLALNAVEDVQAQLFWLRGDDAGSVVQSYVDEGGVLPDSAPRRIRSSRTEHASSGLRNAIRTIRAADAVILHGYFLWWIPLAVMFARSANVPVFLMPHGSLTAYDRARNATKKRLFEATAGWVVRKGVSAVVAGSVIEAEEIVSSGRFARVAYAGVGTRLADIVIGSRTPSAPVRLLTLSRLAPKKRVDLAIEAVAVLAASGIDVRLNVAGAGQTEYVDGLRDLVARLDLEDRVHFAGLLAGPKKTDALLDADIFILPSEDENFGIGVAEAAAHGLPTIASVNVAAAKLLRGDAVEMLEDLRPSTIAAAVERVISAYASTTRASVRSQAEEQFSWGAVAGRWIAVLDGTSS
ncbi:glycosyltransferase [Microbacterium gilvum]|uniref:D-inositol 3-phosphate glycosyltransferase n=1 Tax=Microbacterium gilvum TaxID=1336204 RepID=A0ABP9AC23_9MICO